MRLSRSVLVLVSFLAATAPAAADEDLGWIAAIPGLTAQMQREGPTGEGLYTVAGDPGPVFEKLHAGFVKDGWTIEKFRNTGLAGVSLRTLVAVKGGTRVKLLLNAGADSSQIILNRHRADDPAANAGAGRSAVAAAVGDVVKVNRRPAADAGGPATRVGPRHELRVNRTTATLACADSEIVVLSDRNVLVLQGRCTHLQVNGRRNDITVTGGLESVTVNGDRNNVTWTSAGGAKGPRVLDRGSRNTLRSLP